MSITDMSCLSVCLFVYLSVCPSICVYPCNTNTTTVLFDMHCMHACMHDLKVAYHVGSEAFKTRLLLECVIT